MPLELKDFKEDNLSLEDFQNQAPQGAVLNEKTSAQLAAGESLMINPTVDNFRQTKEELQNPETREQFIIRQQQLRDWVWEDSKSAIIDVLASQELDDETKKMVAVSSTIPKNRIQQLVNSSLLTLAQETAVADSDPDENESVATSRNLLIDSLQEMNGLKRNAMAAINALRVSSAQDTGDMIIDFGELMVPFAQWIHTNRVLKEATGKNEKFLMGNQLKVLYDTIKKAPIEQRPELIEDIIKIVQDNENVILPDGNDVETLHILEKMLVDGTYTDFERYFDNTVSILDVLGLGALAGKLLKGGKAVEGVSKAEKVAEDVSKSTEVGKPKFTVDAEGNVDLGSSEFSRVGESNARTEIVRTDVAPTSPSQIVKDTNPEEARKIHKAVADSTTDEAAEALYGSSKTEAMAKDILPEPGKGKGEIPNKVEMRKPVFEEPERIKKVRSSSGHTQLSDLEIGKVHQKIIGGFQDIEGMVLHPSSLVVRANLDSTLGISARYSFLDGGFTDPKAALESAKYAFRNYGLPDDSFTLLARKGDKWVETTIKDEEAKRVLSAAGAKNKEVQPTDYSIGVKYDYNFRPEDLSEVELLTTGGSIISRAVQFLDRMPTQFLAKAGQGSIVQHLLDAASVIHPRITRPAAVALDKSQKLKKLYIDAFDDFTKTYKKLPMDRRALMSDYIHQANFEGIKFDITDLYSRGFTKKEIEALKVWRKANDAMWYAANDDMVKTLRLRGYKALVHSDSDTRLVGKSIKRDEVNLRSPIYDPVEGKIVSPSRDTIDKLYEGKGEIFSLQQPVQIDGQWVDQAISRNTPQGGYTRNLYDGEFVLNYRDGYYPVMYDASHFIEKTIRVGGEEKQVVIASARDIPEADRMLKRLSEEYPDDTFTRRLDRRLDSQRSKLFDEGSYGLATNGGLTTQKVRGQRLADAGADLQKMGHSNLKDPLEAVAEQIHFLSQRVSMREYMETVKRRFLLQYGPHLDLPKNPHTHKPEFPNSVAHVKGKGGVSDKIVQEARTTFNYLHSLENSYINMVDETYKGVLHAAANFLGELGIGSGERVLRAASKASPVNNAKSLAFKFYLSSSPATQAIVQRGQILQIGAVNPGYFAKGMIPDLIGLDMVRAGISKDPKYLALWDEVRNSGVIEAVDAHNFIRSDLLKLADLTVAQKARSGLMAPINWLQKVGFDAAEQDVLLSAWLSFRDKALKAGKNIKDQRVADEILGEARAFTGDMNRAGEMPYGRNFLSLPAQFFSFRHKMLLQSVTNRNLTRMQRAQLLAFNTMLFGVDATIIKFGVDQIWGDSPPSPLKDKIKDGMLDYTLNTVLTELSGEQQNIDWGKLAPTEVYGLGDVFFGVLTTDAGEMLANSPGGSLFFGSNPRLTDAFKTGVRYFYPPADYDDPLLQTKFSDVIRASLHTFSGYSSLFKGQYAFQTGTKMASSGRISDQDVTAIEAIMTTLGFNTKTEEGYRKAREILYGDKSYEPDDVVMWYKELKRMLAKRGKSKQEDLLEARIMGEAWRVFGEDRPRAMEIIRKEIEKDAANGDYVMMRSILAKMDTIPESDLWDMINTLPAGDVRDKLTDVLKARKELSDGG